MQNENTNEASSMAMFHESFEKLNEYQKAAVIDHRRILLVNAHVGSGKTTVLIHKILYLHFIKQIPLQSMVVLTFTNKAAQEIKDRVKQLNSSITDEEMKFFGTFHSVARTLLKTVLPIENTGYTSEFTIADAEEIQEIYERVINEYDLSIRYKNKLKKRLEKYKQGQLLYGNMKYDDDIAEFLQLFKRDKIKSNIMDFDDLIDYTIELLPQAEFCPKWIIIDEFQDSDEKQLKLIELMAKNKSNIFAVGDPNQVIYSWRGGSTDIFDRFRKGNTVEQLTLPVNYRSTSTILMAAKTFLENGHDLEGVREKGSKIIIKKHFNTFNEALYICERIMELIGLGIKYKDIAVFYRKQKHSEVFRDVFAKHEIPFEVSVKKTLRDIPVMFWMVRVLKAAVNINDRNSLMYILCDKRYGFGLKGSKAKEALTAFYEAAASKHELLNRIKGFKDWCSTVDISADDIIQRIYDYFDISLYILPTSITFEEDKSYINKLLYEIVDYSRFFNLSISEAAGNYIDSMLMGSSRIIDENINTSNDSVKLMTLHSSKGLEFCYVFISGANLGNIPMTSRDEEGEREEQRLFFVGMTRAKDGLEISYHVNPEDFGVYGIPSPYLRMIPEELIESDDLTSRASSLNQLRKEIKSNIDNKAVGNTDEADEESKSDDFGNKIVIHDKYGEGKVIKEDENNITVDFPVYGEKVFSKLFNPLKYK